jgi:uncharacterized protein YndB with AHSA1/START domain
MTQVVSIEPVVKSMTVRCPRERAFEVFTREVGSWWPTETHALHPGKVAKVVIEEHAGGEWCELALDGERGHIGTVLTWEPPSRLVVSWEVSTEHPATEVDVRFSTVEGGTRVDLEHRRWERLGDEAGEQRASYDEGWTLVLGRYETGVG